MFARDRERDPFRASQLRSGDPYELSYGTPIRCAPTGGAGSASNALGASVVGWDPAVTEVGVDAGYSPAPDMLRAPDVAVGNVPMKSGWIQGAPLLAIEYADSGQDEEKLRQKIDDLLHAGTEYLWVVRLTGPRRVEVHRPGESMHISFPGARLTAPGVLQNPVPVEALYDRDAAERVTLVNLLQRQGFADLEAVLDAGRIAGLAEGHAAGVADGHAEGLAEGQIEHARRQLRHVLARRKLSPSAEALARIDACADVAQIDFWFDRALDAATAEEVFAADDGPSSAPA